MFVLVMILLGLLLPSTTRAATPSAPPPFIWVHPAKSDMFAMTLMFTTANPDRPELEKVTGHTGRINFPSEKSDQDRVFEILAQARATCDTLPGDGQPWAITRIDTTKSGAMRTRDTRKTTWGALRCASLDAMNTLPKNSRIWAGFRQLSVLRPQSMPQKDVAVLSPGHQRIQQLQMRNALIRDAEAARSDHDFGLVAFDIWTAHAAGGRGVRLATGPFPALDEDPAVPVAVKVNRATLQEVVAKFLGRREIEIAGNFPVSEATRNGVTGWAGALETDAAQSRTWVVYGSHVLPYEGAQLGRELVDFLSTRDRAAAGAVASALALGETSPPAKPAPLVLATPAPVAITVVPTTGEDLAEALLVRGPTTKNFGEFADSLIPRPDPDFPVRGWFTANSDPRSIALMAAQLEAVRGDQGAGCDPLPQYPAWPPTWRVRVYSSETKYREFTVPVNVVRCRALARYDALGRTGDSVLRSAMETLVKLGVGQYEPEPPNPAPPQRLAPSEEREALLALAQGPAGQPRTGTIGVSLFDPYGASLRMASGNVFVETGSAYPAAVLDDARMRAALKAILTHPAFIAGLSHTRSDFPRRQPSAQVRVMEHYPGLRYPLPKLVSYVSRDDLAAIERSILAAVGPVSGDMLRERMDE